MKQIPKWVALSFSMLLIATIGLFSYRVVSTDGKDPVILEGSTPGGEEIKFLLGIPSTRNIDFIRWHLVIRPGNGSGKGNGHADDGTYTLNVDFGISKPNTLGFTEDRGHKTFEGTASLQPGKIPGEPSLYVLSAKDLPADIRLYAINANLLHILSRNNELLAGDGGWSYTLNRTAPAAVKNSLPNTMGFQQVLKDTARTITYVGRTPCADIARDKHLTVPYGCFKLKWKLVLQKDQAGLPSTFTLHRTDQRQKVITGKWSLIVGHATNPNTVLLSLDPDDDANTTSLLLLDPQVAVFLDKEDKPYTGNKDFSYTLDRRY
jgi:hypothetical protein